MTLTVKAAPIERENVVSYPCLMKSRHSGWIMLVTEVEGSCAQGIVVSDPQGFWSTPIMRYSNRMAFIRDLEPWVGKVEFISE